MLAPFNLSPRRELPSHIKAHEREEQMAKEKEEEAARCVHKLNLRFGTQLSEKDRLALPILPILGVIVALE